MLLLLLRCCRLLASIRLHNGQYVLINTIVSAWENTSNHEPKLRASNLFQQKVIKILINYINKFNYTAFNYTTSNYTHCFIGKECSYTQSRKTNWPKFKSFHQMYTNGQRWMTSLTYARPCTVHCVANYKININHSTTYVSCLIQLTCWAKYRLP